MFRSLARFTGLWLLAISVVSAVIDASRSIADQAISITPLGQSWYGLHRASLNLVQAVIERYVRPEIWDPGITSLLHVPTFIFFGVLSLALLLLGRPRRDPFENL